jgi:rubrerythrin
MSIEVQEAIKRSLQTEKNAMHFYQHGAEMFKDPEASRMFALLAKEEREHAGHFFKIYKGTDIPSLDAFLDAPSNNEGCWSKVLSADFNAQKVMEIALQNEKSLEEALLDLAARMRDPEVKAIYEINVRETHNHYLLIEAEYARLMGMVDETDMDTFVRE